VQVVVADQMLALAGTLGQSLIGLVYQAQHARDLGDDATAAALFNDAHQAVTQASPDEAGQFTAIIQAFQLRFDDAAASYKPWLAARLADIEAARPSATSSAAAVIVRRAERQLRDQALLFSVRIADTCTAREQLTVLQSQSDPWWSDLGTAWEHENVTGLLLEQEGDLDSAAAAVARAVDAIEAVRAEIRGTTSLSCLAASTVQQVYRNAARAELRRRAAAGAGLAMLQRIMVQRPCCCSN
jgi:hypothetical protein